MALSRYYNFDINCRISLTNWIAGILVAATRRRSCAATSESAFVSSSIVSPCSFDARRATPSDTLSSPSSLFCSSLVPGLLLVALQFDRTNFSRLQHFGRIFKEFLRTTILVDQRPASPHTQQARCWQISRRDEHFYDSDPPMAEISALYLAAH